MRLAAVTAVSTALVLAAFLTACDKAPTAPTGPVGPNSPPLPPTGGAVIARIEIVGPQTVAPNETAQFTAIAHLTDGSTRDVTNDASWSSLDSRVLLVIGPGLATGRERGDTNIRASNVPTGAPPTHPRSTFADKEVIVLPAGTYRLTGRVSEAGVPTAPLVGARVEVTTGTGTGLFATTDGGGRYRLFGVAGETTVRVAKHGYQPQARTLVVAEHKTFDIELPLSRPRADVSGIYTLMITAADDCRAGLGEGHLPEEVRVRRYTAIVSQRDAELDVVLIGARFVVYDWGRDFMSGDRFRGRAEPAGAFFSLSWDGDEQSGYYENVVEELTTSTVFVVQGTVFVAGPTNRLAGMLDGTLSVHSDWHPRPRLAGWSPIAFCTSATHQFVLSR